MSDTLPPLPKTDLGTVIINRRHQDMGHSSESMRAYGEACAAAYKADAERYRYLRDRNPDTVLRTIGPAAGCWIDSEEADGTLVLLTGEDADAAIDAAIRAGALNAPLSETTASSR